MQSPGVEEAGQGQSPARKQPTTSPAQMHTKALCFHRPPLPRQALHPALPVLSPRCPELPGLVSDGWDRIPALTALVTAPQVLFMLGRRGQVNSLTQTQGCLPDRVWGHHRPLLPL